MTWITWLCQAFSSTKFATADGSKWQQMAAGGGLMVLCGLTAGPDRVLLANWAAAPWKEDAAMDDIITVSTSFLDDPAGATERDRALAVALDVLERGRQATRENFLAHQFVAAIEDLMQVRCYLHGNRVLGDDRSQTLPDENSRKADAVLAKWDSPYVNQCLKHAMLVRNMFEQMEDA